MADITLEVTLQAAPEAVFDTLDDPSVRPQWQRSLHSVQVLSAEPAGQGVRWKERTRLGPAFEMQIVEHERPHRWAERGHGGGVAATLAVTLERQGEGSRLQLTLSLVLPWLLRPATPLLRRLIARELTGDLQRLDALARSRCTRTA